MNKHAYWTWAIKNCTVVICWTVLAIIFNKWWIALFAVLFMSDLKLKSEDNVYRICDLCGKKGPVANNHDDAIEKAKKAGWVHCENDKDYCPECYIKMLNGGK